MRRPQAFHAAHCTIRTTHRQHTKHSM
jgi:hypothetical protein